MNLNFYVIRLTFILSNLSHLNCGHVLWIGFIKGYELTKMSEYFTTPYPGKIAACKNKSFILKE